MNTTQKIKLTRKQQHFSDKWLNNKFNGTDAAMESYNAKSKNVAHSIASENLRKPAIAAYIESKLAERVENIADMIDENWVLKQMMQLLESAKMESTKVRVLELFGKYKAMWSDKVINENGNIEDYLDEIVYKSKSPAEIPEAERVENEGKLVPETEEKVGK